MYSDIVTLFNFHRASGMWYATVISGADVGSISAGEHTTAGEKSADSVSVIIRCGADKSIVDYAGGKKRYLEQKEYAECRDPDGCFTFKPECDFIYSGSWKADAPIPDDDYDCGFYHYVNSKYDGVYIVTAAEFFGLLPHFEVKGR